MNLHGNVPWLTAIALLLTLLLISCVGEDIQPTQMQIIPLHPTLSSPVSTHPPTLPPTNTPRAALLLLETFTPTTTPSIAPSILPTPFPSLTPSDLVQACETPGRIVRGVFPSAIAGPERSYRIYLPPCYGEDGRSYPAIYLFHGGAHADDHWDNLGVDDVAEKMMVAGSIPSTLIVMPDGGDLSNTTSGGSRSFEGLFISELLPYVDANYCTWDEPRGRALGGISRGGYWALEIAFRHPELLSAVGGHSAALLDKAAGSDTNPQETALTNDLSALRIFLDIGRHDWLLPQVLQLHMDMEEKGVEHTWVLNEGQHTDDYWREHLEEYLEWYTESWPMERYKYPLCQLSLRGVEECSPDETQANQQYRNE